MMELTPQPIKANKNININLARHNPKNIARNLAILVEKVKIKKRKNWYKKNKIAVNLAIWVKTR